MSDAYLEGSINHTRELLEAWKEGEHKMGNRAMEVIVVVMPQLHGGAVTARNGEHGKSEIGRGSRRPCNERCDEGANGWR